MDVTNIRLYLEAMMCLNAEFCTRKIAHTQVYAGMADFQHVVPVHAAKVRKRKRLDCPNVKDDLVTG